MKLARKYSDYLVYQLLESVMVTSKEFKNIIHDMPNGDKIADILYNIIDDKTDIKTNYNLIDVDKEKNDEVSFLPDNQYQRFLTKGDDVTTKTKGNAKIGRMINQILKDNGHNQFKDTDVEKFINNFKSTWNKKHGIVNRKTEVVKGKDILKWYNINNYNSDKGTLGSSCMRYEKVNHFMNIYAENPDKISMVIITDEGKLVARALFWVLDETSQGNKKFYLDRIYTEQDSDFQFLFDWVVDNLCNKDPKILASHKNSENQYEMKVFLNKVNFEHYPYADSFNYLYEKIDKEGKILGNGYVSNFNHYDDKDITRNYSVSEIRNHNEGLPSRLSHVFSKKLNMFINRKEAIQDSEAGWIPKSMCKKCEFLDEWIYQDNAVWSESMQDWIDKRQTVDTKEFGLIHRDAIIKVATKYIGDYLHPIDFMSKLESGVNLFEIETKLKSNDWKRPEYRLGGERYYSDDLVVKDIWNEWQIKQGSFELFDCGKYDDAISKVGNFTELVREKNGKAYILKEDAILFGLTPGDGGKWISVVDLKSYYENLNYTEFMKFVDASDIDQSTKDSIIETKTKFHEYWLQNSSNYVRKFEIYSKMGGVDGTDLYLKLFDLVWKEFMTREEAINREIKERFEYYNVNLTDDQIQLVWEILSGLTLAFIYFDDTNDSRGTVHDWLKSDKAANFKEKISNIRRGDGNLSFTDFTEICRMVFRDFIDDTRGDIRTISDRMATEYNINRSSFISFINNAISFRDLNPYV
jgi:hypothetical protein